MAKRTTIKKGDVFKAKLSSGKCKFFQYLLLDPALLNSEVIRVFEYEIDDCSDFDIKEIVKKPISFYSHVVIKWGIQMGLWEKVGNIPLEPEFTPPLFRDTFGIEDDIVEGKIIYRKTNEWQIWRAGDPFEYRRKMGWVTEENKNVDLGLVFSPLSIIHRMETGNYLGEYYT